MRTPKWNLNILSHFNDLFGDIDRKDADNIREQIARIPGMVSQDQTYQNAMRNSDKQEARTESDRVLQMQKENLLMVILLLSKKWMSLSEVLHCLIQISNYM